MKQVKKYWTVTSCKNEALKYNSRSKFKKEAGGAYNFAKKQKILNDVCSHMVVVGNRFMRTVYVYKFSDNHIYVGLTKNINERDDKHKRDPDSAVYKHMKNTNLTPILSHSNYMDINDAIKLESLTIANYKNDGYNILNIAAAGAVGGGNIIWTFEKCKNEALKYERRIDFARKSESAYNAARRYRWLEKICKHMLNVRKHYKPVGYWTKNRCKKEALKYNKRNEFSEKSSGAYMACLKNKWLNEVCTHMKGKVQKPNNYWTIERCRDEAKKYISKSNFIKYSGSAYQSSRKNGWLNEICLHMLKTKNI